MTDSKNRTNSILVQGSILAIASFISRLVGLIYRVPLTAIIGKTGNDYYGTAYSVYSILLIISSYSLPLAVSKLVSTRVAQGEMKNARKMFRGAMLFAIISGGTAGTILFAFADVFAGWLQTPLAAIALRVLAPVLLVTAIVGVFRGFFQGMRTMIPTAVSQIIEQIANAVVSVLAAYFLFSYGAKVGAVLGNSEFGAAYGAAGGTLGTATGCFAALIFMFILYMMYKKTFNRKLRKDHTHKEESIGQVFHIILITVIPVILSTTLYNITSLVEMYIFKNVAVAQEYPVREISEWWGVYNGEFLVLQNVPISIASAMASTSVPALSASYAEGDRKGVRSQIRSVTRFIMAISFPCMVGLMVLSQPLMVLLFGDADPISGKMLFYGALAVPFYSLSTLSNGILQGIDKMKIPVRNAALTIIFHVLMLLVLMVVFHMNIFAVVIANIFNGLFLTILNDLSVKRYSGVRLNIKKTYLIPLLSAVIMGAFVYLAYFVVDYIVGITAVSVLIATLVGMFSYFVLIIKLKGITEDELYRFPKGGTLITLARKMHLL